MKSVITVLIIVGLVGGGIIWFFSAKESQKEEPDVVAVGSRAPEVIFQTFDGQEKKLSQFQGKPVMFWLLATWCPTCQIGAKVLAEKLPELEKYNFQIIALKLYNNLGYPGPSIEGFGKEWAGRIDLPNWLWGDASKETSFLYDPNGSPDIYFLIDREGVIRIIDTAPHVTMNKILDFAKSPSP